MRTLTIDQGSGSTSAAIEILFDVLGVGVHNMTTMADPDGLRGNESISNVVSGVIAEIDAKGDVIRKQELGLTLPHD